MMTIRFEYCPILGLKSWFIEETTFKKKKYVNREKS